MKLVTTGSKMAQLEWFSAQESNEGQTSTVMCISQCDGDGERPHVNRTIHIVRWSL